MLHLRRSSRFQLPCLPSAYLRTSSRLPSGRNNFTKLDFNGYVVVSWWCLLIERNGFSVTRCMILRIPSLASVFPSRCQMLREWEGLSLVQIQILFLFRHMRVSNGHCPWHLPQCRDSFKHMSHVAFFSYL